MEGFEGWADVNVRIMKKQMIDNIKIVELTEKEEQQLKSLLKSALKWFRFYFLVALFIGILLGVYTGSAINGLLIFFLKFLILSLKDWYRITILVVDLRTKKKVVGRTSVIELYEHTDTKYSKTYLLFSRIFNENCLNIT